MNTRKLHSTLPKGEDPCNPLYWYPRNIPKYCDFQKIPKPVKPENRPLPMPIPVPLPLPPPNAIVPLPPPSLIPPPLPFGVPLAPPSPMMPVVGIPYPAPPNPGFSAMFHNPIIPSVYGNQKAAMVPGLPGIVTHDGGINILPFSDAYSDLLEKQKQKMLRRKLQRILKDYEDFPKPRHFWRRKRLREVLSE
ncbi:unnamed protein product [Parnassius apollo]|uniref:(apollo) hypothetical protein n=1 Tax=Parnassius apollo TaxID=110799 RepID=A0A8S3VYG1_PARAO|nr:unnamed protein product [Parnassius apollo]